jgi:type IV pilus assembly protein PilF
MHSLHVVRYQLGLIILLVFTLVLGGCGSKPSEQEQRDQAALDKLVTTNVRLAGIYLQRGQLNFAKEKADKAIEADPKSSMANNMMGILSWRLKDYDAAEKYFHRAVKYKPENALAANNYGAFLCDIGKIDQSLKYFDSAAQNPYYEKRSQAMINAGRCLMKKPDMEKASEYFRNALKYNAKESEALYYLAKINYESNRTLTARGFLTRYFETGSQSAESLYLAVRVESAMGDKRMAIRYARRLKDQYPTSPEASRVKIR